MTPKPPPAESGGAELSDGYSAWLIELRSNSPTYYKGIADDDWTPDHNDAMHYSRKRDAQRVIDEIGWTEAFPSEHGWQDGKGDNETDGLPLVIDLALLVSRLVYRLRKDPTAEKLRTQAIGFLRKHGLEGSPLRAKPQPASNAGERRDWGAKNPSGAQEMAPGRED